MQTGAAAGAACAHVRMMARQVGKSRDEITRRRRRSRCRGRGAHPYRAGARRRGNSRLMGHKCWFGRLARPRPGTLLAFYLGPPARARLENKEDTGKTAGPDACICDGGRPVPCFNSKVFLVTIFINQKTDQQINWIQTSMIG